MTAELTEQIGSIVGLGMPAVLLLLVWAMVWKGLALWHAARDNQRGWFIVLLIINTVGLLEIFYLYVWRKRNTAAPAANQAVPPAAETKVQS